MHTALSLIIMLMGLVGMLLVVVTSEKFRQSALNDQFKAVEYLVNIKAQDLLRELTNRSRDMGLAIQSSDSFRLAVNNSDRSTLESFLDNQFHQYFVTAGLVKLEKLRVWSRDFTLLAQSSEGTTRLDERQSFCPDVIEQAKMRQGATRLRILSSLCTVDGAVYHSVLVPVGGLRVSGYLEIVADPAHGLAPIESALGMPLQISYPNGDVVYHSPRWPRSGETKNTLVMEYWPDFGHSRQTVKIAVGKDMTEFYAQLKQTRNNLLVIAGMVTIATILLSLYLLRKTTINPLSNLVRKLQLNPRVRIAERRSKDNSIVREIDLLHDIYAALERMALTDPLTALCNRTAAQEYLDRLVSENAPFALLLFDLDHFKEVNDVHGHHVGDQLLREVGVRLKQVLRTSDLMSRLDGQMHKQFSARLGGDEFVIVLPLTNNVPDAAIIARKLLKVMEQPLFFEGKTIQIDMSIGIALYPAHAPEKDILLQRADAAMYHAKSNQLGFAVYDDSIIGPGTRPYSKKMDPLKNELLRHSRVTNFPVALGSRKSLARRSS